MKILNSIKTRLLFWQMLLLASVLITLLQMHQHVRHNELISTTDVELRRIQNLIMPAIASKRKNARASFRNETPQRRKFFNREMDDMPARLNQRFDPPKRDQPTDPRRKELSQIPAKMDSDPVLKAKEVLDDILKKSVYIVSWSLRSGEEDQRFGNVPESLKFETYYNPDDIQQTTYTRNGNRELVIKHRGRNLIVIGQPLTQINKQMTEIRENMLLVGISIFIFALLSGRIIIDRGLRPVRVISDTAREIASGRREKRIRLSDAPQELEGMATTLNHTFDSLDEAIRRQARFTADASHELRTPVSIIMAQTQTVLRKERTIEQYKSALSACLRAGRRMKNLSDSLLDLTRMDAQGLSLDIHECDLGPLLSDAAEFTDDISDKHKVTYIASATSVLANVDNNRIQQVIINLVGNAIKHNPEGCEIEVSLEADGNNALIKLSDNGIGIPADHLPHIFERFYRVDKSRSRESGGSGLGLSIVRNIVEAHNGTITAESIPGTNTTFTVYLPICVIKNTPSGN